MVTKAFDLLQLAKRNGVNISLNDGELQVKVSKGSRIDPHLLQQLKENKPLLTEFLQNAQWQVKKVEAYENELRPFDRSAVPYIPLSFSQERLWFIDQLEGSSAYHIPIILKLAGHLNEEALAHALRSLVKRHEVLRSTIRQHYGQGYQAVLAADDWQLTQSSATHIKDGPAALKSEMQRLIEQPFDLATDYLLRAHLLRLSDTEHLLIVTLHHIASDGWSLSIIVKEVAELYNAFVENRPAVLEPLPLQYADYAYWQRTWFRGEMLEKKISYWKGKLSGVAPLALPTDYDRPAQQNRNGAAVSFTITKGVADELTDLCQQQQVTLFMLLMAAWQVLLHRYSGQDDICVGTPVANRNYKEVEGLVGFFINTLAIRNNFGGNISFTELLHQVRQTTFEAYEHQELPFEKIVDEVSPQRDLSRSPIFQAMFVLQNTPDVPHLKLGELQLLQETPDYNTTKFDITLAIKETPNGLSGAIEYNANLYSQDTINRMAGNFKELLTSITLNPQQKTGLLRMLTQEEQHLLQHFNNTQVTYPKDKTIVSLFEEQVRQTPSAIAVTFGKEQLTYGQLNTKATQLAHYLIEQGVQPQTLVPICIERGLNMMVGLLGILKAGAAYVPVDPEYPTDRIQHMLQDSKAAFVITSEISKAKLPETDGIEIISIDGIDGLAQYPDSLITGVCTPQSLAYIIYTSGSTGRPKGVMIEHRNVVRLFKNDTPLFDFGPADVWTMFHSFCFDFSVWEMYGALLFGGRLVIVPEEATRDVAQFSALLVQEKVTVLNQTPTAFYNLQEQVTTHALPLHTRYVIFGGEALNVSKLQPWHQQYPACRLVNMYGITETTVHVTYIEILSQHIQAGKSVIGKPIPTLSAFILNDQQALAPMGAVGEIYIGGAGLARGYLNLPELTAERFISTPFQNGGRLYKTGDLGRWLPDGNLEYVGRRDEQVKIRGYRIELGEIETAILQSGLVNGAVVMARQEKEGNKQLAGYVVADGAFNKQQLVAYLETKLPGYMVPALWVQIDKLPLTPNGKIDRKALPDPDASEGLSNAFVAPQTDIQKNLAIIWQQLLGVASVGIYDNFFELGGDSILTIQVVSRAGRLGYELRPKDIFIHQTIAGLSAILAERSGSAVTGEQGELTGESGLLPIQQWYLQRGHPNISHFNQSVLLGIEKTVTAEMLSLVVQKIIEQHDALRFLYRQQAGIWHQEYGTAKPMLVVEDLHSQADSFGAAITPKADAYQRSLNIEQGEIARFVLFQTPDAEAANRLLIVVHHLAVDGVSWRVLLADMELLLTGLKEGSKATLGHKSSSYRQWYEALNKYGSTQRSLLQLPYWKKVINTYQPLPVDEAYADSVRWNETGMVSRRLPSPLTKSLLQEVPRAYHTEINDLLLAALAKTISHYSGSANVIIGLEGHGREDIAEGIDTSHTVGWFTNLYPVLLQTAPGNDNLIKTVKEQLRQVPDRGMGYGVLKYIRQETGLQGGDPWDIVFNYLGQTDNIVSAGKWFSGASEAAGAMQSEEHLLTEKISINSIIRNGQLLVNWTYSSKHFNAATIQQLADDFIAALESLIAHCLQQNAVGSIATPSDYGLGAEMQYGELDRFLDEPYRSQPRRVQLETMYRLSGLQQGMLFHSLYQPGSAAYTEQFACDIVEANLSTFKESWARVIAGHTVLRTAFYADAFSIPVQAVYRTAQLPVTVLDYRQMTSEEQTAAISKYQEQDRAKGFNLTEPPLMRLALLQVEDHRYRMIWTSHHILFDGWSLPVLVEELLSKYEAITTGNSLTPPKADRYEEYIRYIERIGREPEEAYWRNYMQGVTESTLLPFIPNLSERTKGGAAYQSVALKIDAAQTATLQRFAQRHRLTVNTLMQGVWSYLLHQYTNSADVVYGVTVSGRPDDLPGVEQRVGLYINTLPLHSQVQKEEEVVTWLQRLQGDQVASRQYQYTPLSSIQQWAGVPGDLFDTLLIFENYPVSKLVASKQWALQVADVQIREQTNYPLTLMIGSAETINISFEYNTQLLTKAYVQQIGAHFEQALFQITGNAAARLKDIQLLTPAEEQLLHGFNDTQVAYPTNKTIISLLEEQVLKTPDAVAVVFEQEQLTYDQLNTKATQLAHYLIEQGIQPETLVPICIERGLNMIVGLLAILKAGAAYVPIDPEYPADRIQYMLQDSGATFVITSEISKAKLGETKALQIIELEDELIPKNYPITNPAIEVRPNQLAYVIYTSGSTGQPKGVMIEHQSLTNLLCSITDTVAFTPNSSFLSVTTYSFDICYLELYTPLVNGGQLIIVPREVAADGYKLSEALAQNQPTHLQGTPATWQLLLDAGWQNKEGLQMLIGGEAVPDGLKNGLTPLGNVYNMYGPTETTIWSASKKLILSEKVTIGRPLANTGIYIVNQFDQLAAVGCIGEIYIGGDGLARGYLNKPELTSEKFIQNHFSKAPGTRLYKTGDLGRWLPNGDIEYIGRKDEQIKLRGYRIELGEIESAIMQSGLVSSAVVAAKEDAAGNKRLIAYAVTEGSFDQEALSSYIKAKLPAYMMPALFVQLPQLPLTPNGKIDRKALPHPDFDELLSHQYIPPRNAFEQQLAEIWQGLLKVKKAGIHDNFFALGGHSLLAMQMVAAIRRQLQIEVSIRDLFLHPSIAELSAHLQSEPPAALLPTIEKQVRPLHIPPSFSQERLWFIHQLEGSLQYHIPTVLRLTGAVNREALSLALQTVVQRHEVLRTIFIEEDGHPYQQIKNADSWQLNLIDQPAYSTDNQAIQQYVKSLITHPFDLSKDYMLRAHLILLNGEEQVLVVVMHHIAADAWSLPVIIEEIATAYSAVVQNRPVPVVPMPLQYADYAIWQRNYLTPQVLHEKLSYWKQKLEGAEPLRLPVDFTRPVMAGSAGASATFKIEKATFEKLYQFSVQQGSTIFMTLLAAFKVLLHRYSGQTDISVGTSIANRGQQEVNRLVGFFVNTLTFRDQVKEDASFTELLQQVKTTTLEAYEQAELPFEKVVEAVVKDRDAGVNPLFQVMLVLGNTPGLPRLTLSELRLAAEDYDHTISKFDLTFFITESPNGLSGLVQYRNDLYRAETMERMMGHFTQLLHSVLQNPAESINRLPMLAPGEQEQLLSFNQAQVAYPKEATMVSLFEAQVQKTPGAIAVVFGAEGLTYQQLDAKATGLAQQLVQRGIQPDSLVPVYMERSIHLVVGIVGILKAGAAYVPVDTDFPAERVAYILADCGSAVAVSTTGSRSKLTAVAPGMDVIAIDQVVEQQTQSFAIALQSQHLAYIIYTSGSTGQPKGVMVTHQNLVDYVFGLKQQLQIDACHSYALVSSTATDLGNTVLFSSLIFGGGLHLFSKESVSNAAYLYQYFATQRIDCLKIVPSHWQALHNDGEYLLPAKQLIFGGEALAAEIVENIRQAGAVCKVINHYGPTETTIGKLLHITESGRTYNQTIPIGKPFSNTAVYVLNKALQLAPVGVPGQLYIAGDGVAKGYLNNDALTKEKFIQNPYSETEAMMYATGDVVKWLPDGNIEFGGRVDDQVKIRGYRVELGEVEAALRQSDGVTGAAVLANADAQGNKRLVAYVVPDGYFDREGILEYLREKLPDYMVPSVLMKLEELPLLPNGKIDRKALPHPDASAQKSDEYVAPQTEVEKKLAAIWEEVLEVEAVSTNANFFELGGHSLLAVRLISAIRKGFAVEVPIGAVFDYPTIAELATQLNGPDNDAAMPPITAVHPRPAHITLSFSQERLWFIDRLEGTLHYHLPAVLRLKGMLNVDALSFALQQIINRHEVLRTVIGEEDGQPFQLIREKNSWQLSIIDGSVYTEDAAGLQHHIKELIQTPFNLAADDMLRAALIRISNQDQVLVVTLHHIVSDAYSTPIIVRELAAFYNARIAGKNPELPPLPVQYADFALWQRAYLQGDTLETKLAYWKKQLEVVTPLQLPTDNARPLVQSTRGAITHFKVNREIAGGLTSLANEQGCTLFMVLLAAFKVLLYRYSGQQDICVGTPVAGRQQQELEGLIGFFINSIALRSTVDSHASFTELLQQVRATTLAAYSHQEVPFEKVVEQVTKDRDMSRSPLFQVMLTLQNTPETSNLRLGDLQLSSEGNSSETHTTSKFDFTFFVVETAYGLQVSVEYCTDLYKETTIRQLSAHFTALLQAAVQQPGQSIGKMPMLGEMETARLLEAANTSATMFPDQRTVVARFQEQVLQRPDAMAVVFGNEQLTYSQLNERTNRLARYLTAKGVQTETLVPVCIKRSPELLTAMLAILKAGGAYVPIDPDYPSERIQFMLQDTGATLLLASREVADGLPAIANVEVIDIQQAESSITQSDLQPASLAEPHHLAYVIYTSGSTGRPKGVMIEHQSLTNLINWHIQAYEITAESRATAMAGIGFDAFGWEVWPYLSCGARLYPIDDEVRINQTLLAATLIDNKITHSFVATALAEAFVNEWRNRPALLQYLLTGGDKLPAIDTKGLPFQLVNNYGPTENTVVATNYLLTEEDKTRVPPIGKPIANTAIYLLDEQGQLVPDGVWGELCIGGAQVARGYLNSPQLTAEKFISDPFIAVPGAKLYKTGDMARWGADGNLEYGGRKDNQVKIRGYRIELGEIENELMQCPLVKEAVVLAVADPAGNSLLVAYIVPKQLFDKEGIIAYLKDKLPAYMIPAAWVELNKLPVTPNGKVDRQALPLFTGTQAASGLYVAPRTETEEKLAAIWQELLRVPQVGMYDNFFELGGHSLMAMRMVTHIEKSLGVTVPIKALFQFTCINDLSNYLDMQTIKKPDEAATSYKLVDV